MVLEIVCPEDAACCQDLNQLTVTSVTSDGSTLAPRSEHNLHGLVFWSHSDGSESDASLEDEAPAWSIAVVEDGVASLEDEVPAWSTAMIDVGDDDYDPRDARFVRKASDGSIEECRRRMLDDQIARLGAAVQRRSPREGSSSALVRYSAVLRELREEAAAAGVARASGGAASAWASSGAASAWTAPPCADLGLAPLATGDEVTRVARRPLTPLPRMPWVVHDALDSSLSGGLLEEALFGGNSRRGASPLERCRWSRRFSRSRSPPWRAAHTQTSQADDYDIIGSSCYA